jgi:hypothetical protein
VKPEDNQEECDVNAKNATIRKPVRPRIHTLALCCQSQLQRFHSRSLVAMHTEIQILIEYAPLALALVCWLFSL